MFRRPRAIEADSFATQLASVLGPLVVYPWGPLAMHYLGVPIVLGASMIVVHDEDYQVAIQKLKDAGFKPTVPKRGPRREILEDHPNPQELLDQINAGYRRVDRSCSVFNYPDGSAEGRLQVFLFPNSFTHLYMGAVTSPSAEKGNEAKTEEFEVYGTLRYPLERALVDSFVKAAIDEEEAEGYSSWGELLRSWISLMTGYLEVNNDILDHCPDTRAVKWYSANYGRIREAEFGPIDRRITKRLGSGKEMPIDMRGNPI